MVGERWAVVLGNVRTIFRGGTVAGLSEGQLLDRFVSRSDPTAFEALMARHGPMVLGVCRSVLHDPHDVEDAFQATFLVLVRKAAGLRDRDLLAPWLHGVARKVSLRARSDASRRNRRERTGTEVDPPMPLDPDAESRELQATIRDEVDRLPGHERTAVILCYLEGMTHEEAADRLGWPVGTVKGRLARARDRLRDRLTRRGVTAPAGAVSSTLTRHASAAVPADLIASTTLAAARLAAGKTLTAGIVSAHALALAEGVIRTMMLTKLKIGGAAVLAVCTLSSPGVVAYQLGGPGASTPKPVPPATPLALDPAISVHFTPVTRVEPAELAVAALDQLDLLEAKGEKADPSAFQLWARRLVDVRLEAAGDRRADRIEAIRSYTERLRRRNETLIARLGSGNASRLDVLDACFRHEEAARWLAKAQAEPAPTAGDLPSPSQPSPTQSGGEMGGGFGGGFGGGADAGPVLRLYRRPAGSKPSTTDEARNKAILDKLDRLVPMKFGPGTSLSQVVQYLKEATKEPDGKPIPIYVDPIGLQEAEKTMSSPISLSIEGIPLRTTLRLLLKQLFLTYEVDDGMLVITNSVDRDEPAASLIGEPSPADKARDANILGELEKEIPMHFPNPTALGDVLGHILRSTKGAYGKPIPIYVDPTGLQEVDKTIDSPVSIDLEGVPLRTTLRLLLGQIGLRHEVRGGMILIDVARPEPEVNPNPTKTGGMGGQGGMM